MITTFCSISLVRAQKADTLWLQKIDLNKVSQGWSTAQPNRSVEGNPLTIAGQIFKNGLGSHSEGLITLDLNGGAQRFQALVGLDDEAVGHKGSVVFSVLADKKEVFRSPLMVVGTKAVKVDVSLKGVKKLSLIIEDGGD